MNGDEGWVDEDDVIHRLLQFDEFSGFYSNEWVGRNTSIKWRIVSSCDKYAMQSFSEDKKPCIVLRQLPVTFDDAYLVAHEMGHVIKYFDKQYIEFKRAQTPIAPFYVEEEITEMCGQLGSMFEDPLIDSFLQDEYHFNPVHFYTSVKIPDSFKSLDLYGDSPLEWHIFKKALFYATFSLEWDAITDVNALREWDKLRDRYKICRPMTTKIGEELYIMSKDNGYDNVEKQRRLCRKIFDKYRLDGKKLADILDVC